MVKKKQESCDFPIYEVAEDSVLLAKIVNEKAYGRVLDICTGC